MPLIKVGMYPWNLTQKGCLEHSKHQIPHSWECLINSLFYTDKPYKIKRWDKFGFSLNNWNNFFVIGCRFDDYLPDERPDQEMGAVYILDLD